MDPQGFERNEKYNLEQMKEWNKRNELNKKPTKRNHLIKRNKLNKWNNRIEQNKLNEEIEQSKKLLQCAHTRIWKGIKYTICNKWKK